MQVIQRICNKVAVMETGQIVEQGSVLEVFGRPRTEAAQRFVRTVINDRIPESIMGLVRDETRTHRVEQLKFVGNSVREPVISGICKAEGVEVNILGATVQEMQDSVMCVFILQIFGSEDQLDRAERRIDQAGVLRERMVFD